MELILELLGDLLLSSKKVKPWIKTLFACTVLIAFTLVLCWGIYMNHINGNNTTAAVWLSVFVAVGLLFGFFYVWKCHRSNWENY